MRTALAGSAVLLASTMILTACTTPPPEEEHHSGTPGHPATVLTTFTILADMARSIAGNAAHGGPGDVLTIRSLTPPGAEIHGYEPTPADVAAAADASLIIDNGLGLEHWTDRLTQRTHAARATASTGITPIPIAGTTDPNPHAWMSPTAARTYVDNIAAALTDLQPDQAEQFRANADSYKRRLADVDGHIRSGLSQLPKDQRALVTCEGAFSYLARDTHLAEGYIWPVNTEREINSDDIRRAADFVRDHHVPAVFCESTVPAGPKQQLMRETGAADGGTLYVDSLSDAQGPVPTYLDLLEYDAKTIVTGLTSAFTPTTAGQRQ
nr:zinc ABC transporter substrate-binding protein [Corynebacterium heidelbergense]